MVGDVKDKIMSLLKINQSRFLRNQHVSTMCMELERRKQKKAKQKNN